MGLPSRAWPSLVTAKQLSLLSSSVRTLSIESLLGHDCLLCCPAFGGFLFGYDIGVISGCLIMPDFERRFGMPKNDGTGAYYLDADRQSIITSLLSAGYATRISLVVTSLLTALLQYFCWRACAGLYL